MLRLIVDSGSSIKEYEKEKYNVDIIPLRISLGEEEFDDGVDLSMDYFYNKLINEKIFPKTSLPNLHSLEEKVEAYTKAGDDVMIITISSGISGTYNTIRMLFEDNEKVRVIDSKSAVGGIKILVNEVNKYRDQSLDYIESKLNEIIPRIVVAAIPETLEYLTMGGRLSKKEAMIGNLLHIKPLIGIVEGKVKALGKRIGIKKAMLALASMLEDEDCDTSFPIVPSYTYKNDNLQELIKMIKPDYQKILIEEDNLDPAIACHWGPNTFGFIFVKK